MCLKWSISGPGNCKNVEISGAPPRIPSPTYLNSYLTPQLADPGYVTGSKVMACLRPQMKYLRHNPVCNQYRKSTTRALHHKQKCTRVRWFVVALTSLLRLCYPQFIMFQSIFQIWPTVSVRCTTGWPTYASN